MLSTDGLGAEPPAAVAKQASRVAWVEEQMAAHELHSEARLQDVLEASKREAKLEEEEARLRRKLGIVKRAGGGEGGGEGEGEGGGEGSAVAVDETWQQFQAVCDVLRVYGALEGYAATELGELVGALSGDNELWLALVLIEVAAAPQLRPPQLAAVLAATLDERARPGAYVGFRPSDEVLEMVETLGGRADALQRVQVERGVGFGVGIEPGSVGLVEAWAEGVSWPQLMAGTSLDAGDIFRLLKRTVELLRQVALVPYASGSATERAREALRAMDRYPIADGALMAVAGDEEDMRARAGRAAAGLDADADAAFKMLEEMQDEESEEGEEDEEGEEGEEEEDILRSISSIFGEQGEGEEGGKEDA